MLGVLSPSAETSDYYNHQGCSGMALALQVLIVLLLSTSPVFAQKSVSNEDWPNVGRDQGGNRHSPLTQINRSNVSKLEVAWTFDTEDWSDGSNLPSRSAFEATPLVIDGVMYIPSPMSRLFALDAETGEKLWVFDSGFDRKVRRNLYANRGVSTWTDGKKRLLYLGDIEDGKARSCVRRRRKIRLASGHGRRVPPVAVRPYFSYIGLRRCGSSGQHGERRPTPRPQW